MSDSIVIMVLFAILSGFLFYAFYQYKAETEKIITYLKNKDADWVEFTSKEKQKHAATISACEKRISSLEKALESTRRIDNESLRRKDEALARLQEKYKAEYMSNINMFAVLDSMLLEIDHLKEIIEKGNDDVLTDSQLAYSDKNKQAFIKISKQIKELS